MLIKNFLLLLEIRIGSGKNLFISNISTFIKLRTQNAFGILNINNLLNKEDIRTRAELIQKHEIILNDKINKNFKLRAEVILAICQIAKNLNPNISYVNTICQTDKKLTADFCVQTNNKICYNASIQVIFIKCYKNYLNFIFKLFYF